MTKKLRALLGATIISFGGLVAYLAPTTAAAGPTLQIVQGSKDLETLKTAIEVAQQEDLYLQWTTDQAGATGGTWTVTNVTAGNKFVKSGEAGPAPSVGHFARFTIPANAFLQPSPPATPVKFNITIVAHDKFNKTLGVASAAVVVSQVPEGPPLPPINFGRGAVFPSVEIVTYNEKIGVVPETQLHFAGADVTVRVKNTTAGFNKATTDPMWLVIKDNSLLMRQNNPVEVRSLKPGDSIPVSLHLDAILPPPTSQLPEDKQYSQWGQQYRDRCGVDLSVVMDWRGPQGQTPVNDHLETVLLPNTPICDGKQCVRACQIAKNIHWELDGNVVGYSFFVGLYPKFDSYGEARTSANGPAIDFTSKTKITVASVSKMVTAIAAVRILAKKGVSLDEKIGPYLPSDWLTSDPQQQHKAVSTYVQNITFAQLLSQRSGIMQYGNVPQGYYETLRNFFTQGVSKSTTTSCQTDPDAQPSNPINPNFCPDPKDPTKCRDPKCFPCYCYSNYNFDIFRILLPKVAGLAEAEVYNQPQTLARQYVNLVQQNVFDLVGQKGVDCKPPSGSTSYAFAYLYPGNNAGVDWGDVSLRCGAAGWYLSVEDIAKVLLSINAKDGKIFDKFDKDHPTFATDQFEDMRKRALGWEVANNNELEKNGGWTYCDGGNCATISTSVAIFGPATGPRVVAVLFINSNISGGASNGSGARSVLERAYCNAVTPKKVCALEKTKPKGW